MAIEAKKEFRGKRLAPVIVEDELYWGVMKFWYPELQLPGAETGDSQKVLELRSPGPDGAAKSTGTTEPPARSVTRAGNDATVSVKSNRPPKPARTKP